MTAFTVPVGVPSPGEAAATVAVKTVAWPSALVLAGFAASVVVVPDWFTVWFTAGEVLEAKFGVAM